MDLKKYSIRSQFRENIEAEEIFLDAEAIRSLEEKGKLEQPIKRNHFIAFYILIVIGLLALFAKTAYLQIIKGGYYSDLAKGTRLRIYSIGAPRGIIYDESYARLAYNVPRFDLVIDLADFWNNTDEERENILDGVAGIISRQESAEDKVSLIERFRRTIDEAYGQLSRIVLARNVEHSAALALEVLVDGWPGVRLEKNARRYYAQGPYFAHVIGYTGEVSSEDLESDKGYLPNDQTGKSGLECQYEDVLRGENGHEQVQIDSLGRVQDLVAIRLPKSGRGLVLHVNLALQEKFYEALEEMFETLSLSGVKTNKGVAVAIDPRDGGVLALVNLPSFDNNLFAEGISETELESLKSRTDQPFLSRALIGQYPSGSIVKPLIAAAALQEGIITPATAVNCKGAISVVNQYNPEIVYRFIDWGAHGSTDVIEAIAKSCNVFFYAIGGGYGDIEGLGASRIKEYLSAFGLGAETGIDLPYEEPGLIPAPDWKKSRGEEWYLGDTYHLAIGQGDVLITPIQMAAALASIANGGILYQPQVVDKIINDSKNVMQDIPPQIIRSDMVESEHLETVRRGMRQTVVSGSAYSLSALPVQAAGKTGTAQFGNEGKTHAWFIGFAPYENPEIAFVVLVEAAGEGHDVAVPIAKKVLEWYFGQ